MKVTPAQTAAVFFGGTGLFFTWETVRGNPKFYSRILMPVLHALIPAETAHNFSVKILGFQFLPRSKFIDPDCLKTTVWNKTFNNPLGIAAGFDKHAEAMYGLEKLGFGFVEVGSIAPLPQAGNPKPRVFRLSEDMSVINRYGFNSCGHDEAAQRLAKWRAEHRNVILGINLGKNKSSVNHVPDYVAGVAKLGRFADYIVINVSSPNTPGLRNLQQKSALKNLCIEVNKERRKLPMSPPPVMLVKLSPDLESNDIKDIAEASLMKECGIDGLIISNTTTYRPNTLQSRHKVQCGGLSGPPVREMSTELIKRMFLLTEGRIPIIGVGGVSSGKDAYEKIRAGASLVQIYTSLIFQGPPVVKKIKEELAALLTADGYKCIGDAVGADHRP